MALGRTRTQRARGAGARGREGGESQDRKMTRLLSVCGGEGWWGEKKVDFAAQCQDPKNNNPVFLLLLSM